MNLKNKQRKNKFVKNVFARPSKLEIDFSAVQIFADWKISLGIDAFVFGAMTI